MATLHLDALRTRFGDVGPDFPLFPSAGGSWRSKEAVVDIIERAASFLGLAATNEVGGGLVGGHALRVSGAQLLAALGVDTEAIQLIGR